MKLSVGFSISAIAWVGLAGCGGGGPKLAPVTGTVTVNNKPLEGASIVFTPDATNKDGQVGFDTTGPSGNYKITTNGRSGLVPGPYKITVTKARLSPAASSGGEADADPYMDQLASGPKDPSLKVGKKAADEEIQGDFERTIPPEGGVQDFDVKSKEK